MTEILDSKSLIELVVEKHKRLLDTYGSEFTEIDGRLNSLRQQADAAKKELETTESKIAVLTEKYHLLFYQAKKQREEMLNAVIEKMRHAKAAAFQDVMRLSGRIEEFEKKLQNSKHIEDEEKSIAEIKKLLYDIESAAGKSGIMVSGKGIIDKLNEANSSHKELLSLQEKPKLHAESGNDLGRKKDEIEGRHKWLKHRLESHDNALSYWEKQKGGLKVD